MGEGHALDTCLQTSLCKGYRVAAAPFRVTAVLAGLMLVGCASSQRAHEPSVPAPGLPVPASAIHRLTVIADRIVKVNGGAAPTWVSVVVTSRVKALTSATPGDTVPGFQANDLGRQPGAGMTLAPHTR